ncbi:glycosyl transferase family 90-domain-containing protein [Mycena floridula]|nr:glycosyl transferase family 90-domain-containing protein [Mycena floridula]
MLPSLRYSRRRPRRDSDSRVILPQSAPRNVSSKNRRLTKLLSRRRTVDIALLLVLVIVGSLFVSLVTDSGPPTDYSILGVEYSRNETSHDAVSHARISIDHLYAGQSDTLARASARYRMKTNRLPPKNYDEWFNFASEQSCLIDDYDQIYADVEPFYQLQQQDPDAFAKILNSLTETAKDSDVGMVASQIRGGKYTENTKSEWAMVIERFATLLPDMDLIVNRLNQPRVLFNHREPNIIAKVSTVTDPTPFQHPVSPVSITFTDQLVCIPRNEPESFPLNSPFIINSKSSDFTTSFSPVLSTTKLSPCFSDILIPGKRHDRLSSDYPRPKYVQWDDKKPQLYWRTSGKTSDYQKLAHSRLADLALGHSDILDVVLTETEEDDGHNYKYVLDLDGSDRYLRALRSGSLVFKSSIFTEYFNSYLTPFLHFVPVLPDLSDLVEKVRWAMEHEEEARLIQEVGREFAERVLTDAQNDCYFSLVLLEWARLQDYARTKGHLP